ncbi:MAG: hypothetical protein V8R80_08985 [Eubacterium sp.]
MTLEEQCRLSYYKKIADISNHQNVFLVQHVDNGRIFVMKEQEIYCREVYEYLKICKNPHVPIIFECVENNGRLVIVEEYIQGESLAEHLEEKGRIYAGRSMSPYGQYAMCWSIFIICLSCDSQGFDAGQYPGAGKWLPENY